MKFVHAVQTFLEKQSNNYWLTRFVLLRALGLVYVFAFLSVVFQIVPLVGEHGLTPGQLFFDQVEQSLGEKEGFMRLPSLFWFFQSDAALIGFGLLGLTLSVILLFGYANMISLFVLWILYMSFVHIGQRWYSFGWEIQLLETGFLALFLVPFWDARPFPKSAPPLLIIWLFRWLGFRIMLGAGLIKIRGDECWRDLTCLVHHYETQPIPNPLSPVLHLFPVWMHKLGVLWNHVVELVVPFFMFWPTWVRRVAGLILISFQFMLISSGNLSFLNWLTIVPFIACLDDGLLKYVLPKRLVRKALHAKNALANEKDHVHHTNEKKDQVNKKNRIIDNLRKIKNGLFAKPYLHLSMIMFVLVIFLSYPVVKNLLSPTQAMNTSFGSLHLVNTYGAFGSVGKERLELVVMGTTDTMITDQTQWKEYEFKAKPTSLDRNLPIIAPYHLRVDWLIWFAAMSSVERHPWMINLVWKLLHNEKHGLDLIESSPFEQPPTFIKVDRYIYEFDYETDNVWKRTYVGPWLPPLSKDNPQLQQFVKQNRWA